MSKFELSAHDHRARQRTIKATLADANPDRLTNRLHSPPIVARRLVVCVSEMSIEIREIVEAAVECDVDYRALGFEKKPSCPPDAQLDQVLLKVHPQVLLKKAAHRLRMQRRRLRRVTKRHRFLPIRFDKIQDLLQTIDLL